MAPATGLPLFVSVSQAPPAAANSADAPAVPALLEEATAAPHDATPPLADVI
jgi:hypothetical protein